MDFEVLYEEQKKLSKKLDLDREIKGAEVFCGVDVSYYEGKACCCAVLWSVKDRSILDAKFVEKEEKDLFPYVPGLLSYREGVLMVEAVKKLNERADVVLVDGNGILHPRKFGLACYVGLKTNTPTIGIAKNLLCGDVVDNRVIVDNEFRGVILRTNNTNKPIYVSPGHLINIKSAVETVRKSIVGHRLPEPIWLAHKLSKQKLRSFSADLNI